MIIGGGPAGNTAATHAARLGAEVTLVERDVIGGAAHLWDCIPSKAMIATGGAMSFSRRIEGMGLAEQAPELDLDLAARPHRRDHRAAPRPGRRSPRRPGRAPADGRRPLQGPERDRRRHRRRGRGARGRRRSRLDRQPPAHSRLGRGRRSPRAHDPARLPAAGDPRAPRRDRLGRHRCRVRAHVQLVRLPGHPGRQSPAGAADEGPGGRGRPRGRVPPPRREAPDGRAGRRRRPDRRRRRGRALRRRTVGRRLARAALHRVRPQQRRARARGSRRRGRWRRLHPGQPALRHERAATSTPPATSPGSCRCRRWRPCRDARWPST